MATDLRLGGSNLWQNSALRGLTGGALVVIFALIGSAVKPKAFSGLFSAAPAVAIAGLAITVATESTAKAQQASTGMVLGSRCPMAWC